jgi:PAS domain S-box-containing protein
VRPGPGPAGTGEGPRAAASDGRFEALLEHIPDIVSRFDRALRHLYVNSAVARATGRPPAEFLGKTNEELGMPPDLCARWREALERVFATGEPAEVEFSFPSPGGVRHFAGRAVPESPDGREVESVIVVTRDVTARHRAEQAAASVARFPEENPHPVLRIAADGTVIYANAGARSILAELGGGVDGTAPAAWRAMAAGALESQSAEVFEGRYLGRVFSFDVVPVLAEGYANLYGHDVTELRRAQEALSAVRDRLEEEVRDRTSDLERAVNALQGEVADRRRAMHLLAESNELLERMFANTHLMMAYLDTSFNFIRVNEAYAAADGRSPDYFPGRNHFELYPNPENEAVFRRVVRTGQPHFVYEKPFSYPGRPERGVTYWDWSVRPVLDEDGQTGGLLLALLDVTERKRLEKEVVEIGDRECRRLGQDLHDGLSQRLTALSYRCQNLRRRLADAGDGEMGDELERLTEMAREAIRESRSLARGLAPVELRAGGLMEALAELAARTTETFGIACTFACPRPVLLADEALATHAYRIAQEAVTNAVRHSGGEHIVLGLSRGAGAATIEVEDDGCGLPPGPRTGGAGGGMGLHIMRYRAEMIGGHLALEPRPDGGTRVRVTFPVPASDGLQEEA